MQQEEYQDDTKSNNVDYEGGQEETIGSKICLNCCWIITMNEGVNQCQDSQQNLNKENDFRKFSLFSSWNILMNNRNEGD